MYALKKKSIIKSFKLSYHGILLPVVTIPTDDDVFDHNHQSLQHLCTCQVFRMLTWYIVFGQSFTSGTLNCFILI